jgi:UDP-2,3-diacylglucosamine pyrophosphatase LpxH
MKIKSVFISDTHIGNPMCQYEKLYTFLKSFENVDGTYDVENLFLVGDIIDITGFNHKVFWTQHRKVLKKLIRMADRGVNIVYVIGNHDYQLEREFINEGQESFVLNNIKFCREHIYKDILLIHGDQFDGIVRAYPILYAVGDFGYHILIHINDWQNKFRRFFGIKEWSFSLWVKTRVKKAIQFINHFEEAVAKYAKDKNVNTVIAGHIHKAEDIMLNGIRYANCGCWAEFCSYILEYEDGSLELKYYE